MKKFSAILVICLALFVSVFFGACGSKYKDLNMYFVTESDYVQLVMDDEYREYLSNENIPYDETVVRNATTVKVNIDGIKKKYISNLDIKVIPSDIAVVKENKVIDNTLYFNIYASRPGTGEIQVTHLSSGKSVSITLDVDKKAIGAESKNKCIVLNLPEQNLDGSESFYTYTIDPNSVLTYNPIDATDDVSWEIVGTPLNGVELGNFSENEENNRVNNQIKISSSATEGTFYLTPTLTVSNYEDIKLENIKIPVSIIKVVDENNLKVLSENAISTTTNTETITNGSSEKTYKVITEPMYLFTNSLQYGNAKLYLYTNENTNVLASDDYMKFYSYNITTSSSQIDVKVNNIDNCVDVAGIDFNENIQWFDITFTPYNCVGDIKTFSIRQQIVLTEVADKIAMKMDNENFATTATSDGNASADINLLDYYSKYGNLGQKFNFSVYRTSTHSSLKNLRIRVDEKFYDQYSDAENYSGNDSKNKYLLQFKKGNNALGFGDVSNGYYYSDPFTASDNLYIKYVYNSIGEGAEELNFTVENFYSAGEFEEGKSFGTAIQNTEKKLEVHINRGRGIKSITLFGGYVTKVNGNHEYDSNNSNSLYVLNSAVTAYEMLDIGENNTCTIKQDEIAYGVRIEDIQGATVIGDADIQDINFKCTVFKDKQEVDLFDFAIFTSKDHSGKFVSGNKFKLSSISKSVSNTLLLIKKDGVTIPNGEYTIEISEPIGGYKQTFTYSVVTNVAVNNADVTPFNNTDISSYNKIYTGNDYRKYLFENLFDEKTKDFVTGISDEQKKIISSYLNKTYIVPTKQNIDTTVRLGEYVGDDFILDESFVPYVKDIKVSATPVSLKYDTENKEFIEENAELLDVNYLTNDRDNLIGNFKFDIKLQTGEYGTIYNGEKYFVKVTYKLYSDKFELNNNFYEKVKNNEPTEISYYLFIYVELNETKFEHDASIINTYFYEDLGYYFKDKGENTLKLSLPNQYGKNQSVFDYVDYKWVIDRDYVNDFDKIENQQDHSLTFTLNKPVIGAPKYHDRIIKVEITQFGVKRTIISTIHVHKVILTEKLVIRNSLNYLDSTQSYYVYLKQGGTFKFNVEQVGNPTFSGITYVVCDLAGNVSKEYKINANNELEFIGQGDATVKDIKVLIFATDWAISNLDSKINTYNFNNLSDYTFKTNSIDYSKRVQIIDVKIRDGSEHNPYLIANGSEFKEINNNLDKHYEIVNDINLNGENILIGEFSGSLTSYKDYRLLSSKPSDWSINYKNYYTYSNATGFTKVTGDSAPNFTYRTFYKLNQNTYTVYNILFGGTHFNLFSNVSNNAKISNISFRIGFNNANSNVGYIGLIATNYGTLTNVKVEYSGNIELNTYTNTGSASASIIYMGMLVAQNFGNITYDNANSAYSTGNITIIDNTSQTVYIGGLVGENGTITDKDGKKVPGIVQGVLLESSNTIEYALYYENQGSLFDGSIEVKTTNTNSYLGGVVGFNNNGQIKQVYTSGKLIGHNNVGGLIGKNIQSERLTDYATNKTAYIVDCLSTTQISANKNVGGVTGVDENGSYYHVYYEVYNNNKAITENAYAISGTEYVGGLIGNGKFTQLNYCYFHSFRWGYKFVDPDVSDNEFTFAESEFYNQLPDIYATSSVGGLFGYADSEGNSEITASKAVYITNSVVDAYIKGDEKVGGMVGYANGYAILLNGYVQGAFISNNDEQYYDIRVYDSGGASVDDNSKTNYYSIVFGKDEEASYSIKFIENENITDGSSFVEDKDATINNGRRYIVLNDKPLITQAPTAIELDGAWNSEFDRGTNKFNDSSNIASDAVEHNDKILIYYYNLINNNQQNYINDSASINVINLDDIVDKDKIGITPSGIGARIKVKSSDESVITISASGFIKLISEGVCTLRFESLINPSVYDEITVIIRSMPTDYNIYKNSSMNEILDDSSISIVKDESKFIYENYVGEITVNGTKYLYNTTNDVAVFANIDNKDGKISINGTIFDDNVNENGVPFVGKEPIIISVLEYSETDYTVTMASYVKFVVEDKTYYVKVIEEVRSFTIITKRGVTKINTNVTDAVMSVADKLNVDLMVDTDIATSIDINVDVRNYKGEVKEVYNNSGEIEIIDNNKLFTYNNEFATQFNIDKAGLNEFVLRLNQDVRIEQDLSVTITFSVGKVKTVMYLTLIPQKITSIVTNTYKQEGINSSWKSGSVIRPGQPSMLVIDVAPDTAYFEYLEITDTYSNERISFIQWTEFDADKNGLSDNGQALQEVDTPSSDGFGIKLVKTDKKSFYVYALLSTYAINNVAHTVQVTAYSSSGYVLGSSSVNLEVMLFPTVILSYYNEQDEVEIVADSRDDIQNRSTDLATGIQAKIGVTTYNTDGNFGEASWEIVVEDSLGNYYVDLAKNLSMKLSENGYWYLTYNKTLSLNQLNDLTNSLVGKTVTITASVRQVVKGFEERGEASLTFKFRRFTLNGISAQTGRQTSGNRIGGIVNEDTYLEFYFNNTHNKDISYYQNGEYFNKNYFVDFNENTDKVNAILKEVNNFNNSENIIIKLVHNQTKEEINLTELLKGKTEYKHTINNDVDLFKVTKNNNELTKITVYSNIINNYNLQVSIKYYYNANGEVVLGEDAGQYKTLTCEYGLNFVTNSSPLKYYPIRNSEEFMNMVEGGYYILTKDITLTNYKMLDVNLGGFDGNGYTITIESFDYDSLSTIANGTTGYLGLFKQIYAGEIVENLTVEYRYSSNHYDLSYHVASDNTDYTQFYFGGISAINAGIITNCKVTGTVYLQTSKISPANFHLGGMVSQNLSTAYITNSTVELEISAGGRIGGVVNSNEGKIVSSNFLGSVKAYTTTNTSLSNEINAALFAVTNAGEISMCYVAPMPSNDKNKKYVDGTGVINSGGSLGGFVYTNSGKIYDCYLKDITFSSRGYMGGFVYSSTGTIERCYINSNDTLQGDRYVDIFVYDKTSGVFKDCFYILTENLKSTVDGIKCITELDINKESFYTNFAFNSMGHNVWLMTSEGPTLSSVGAIKAAKTITTTIENGVEKIDYSISGTKEIPYVIYDVDSFTYWFGLAEDDVVTGYFRFVSDIDFSSLQEVIVTSNKVFSGTIEGNNMILSNFSLFTSKDKETNSVGLFKEIRHTRKTNYINNLTLNCQSVRASTASCVGVLAGVIDGGNVYSIRIDNPNLVVLGKNAVGGLAGIIKGNYEIENISSNVSVNASFRQTILSKVNIYNGRFNTGSNTSNINEVSYAGGIAGILEGYDYRINSSVILNNYYSVKNSTVSGNVILIAETVGGAFGFVNERARVTNVTFDAGDNAYLKGVYYSGGLVGESRGIIDNSTVLATENNVTLFDAELNGNLASCVGGITAVNYSGLIYNCKNHANVINMYILATVGGITGRNVGGTINYCENIGALYGFFAGNMAGSDYNYQVLTTAGNSSGAITASTITAINRQESYSNIEFAGKKVEYGYVVTLESLDNWFGEQKEGLGLITKAISNFYTYSRGENKNPYDIKLEYSRILGAVVGITDKNIEYTTKTIEKLVPDPNDASKTITKNINILELKTNNEIFIKVLRADGESIKLTEFVSTTKNLPEGEADENKKYSELQEVIKGNTISEYYYLVPVFNESAYNFYNLTEKGYNDTYARVFTESVA